jgi:hypothetical protein
MRWDSVCLAVLNALPVTADFTEFYFAGNEGNSSAIRTRSSVLLRRYVHSMPRQKSTTAVYQERRMQSAGDRKMAVMEVMILHLQMVNRLARQGVIHFAD